MTRRRRAAMLLLVLVSLTLAAALITPLALLSGVEAVVETHHSASLRHRLAAESVVALLPELLADTRRQQELDSVNRTYIEFDLADLHVEALIQDDTAKLPVQLFDDSRQANALPDALLVLSAAAGLPPLASKLTPPSALGEGGHGLEAPQATGCLDDLFEAPSDAALFGTPTATRVWTQYLTPIGQRVHAYRADVSVLEAALQDLAPGLGTQIAQRRRTQSKPDLDELLEAAELPERSRRLVAQRLATASEHFSVLVRTRLPRDERQRYFICDASDPPRVLVNWEVAP